MFCSELGAKYDTMEFFTLVWVSFILPVFEGVTVLTFVGVFSFLTVTLLLGYVFTVHLFFTAQLIPERWAGNNNSLSTPTTTTANILKGSGYSLRSRFNTQSSYSLNNFLNQKNCLTQIFEPQKILGPKFFSDPKYFSRVTSSFGLWS